jgi:UDP-N-acetylglucosamine--N-acetylmuramyl-(pentapeptide) pyrophosphoryl-undecaprenol N-acetylglucosamine transferase
MNNRSDLQIVFAGGGTAGHLFPGLAVAAELAALHHAPQITFAGSGKRLEERLVTAAGFEYLPLRCAPMQRGFRGMWRFVGDNFAGFHAARRYLRRQSCSVVVGLGGYASLPICTAARTLGIPLVLLEQNVLPGKANRWLASGAELICAAWAESKAHFRTANAVWVTGNPVRAGFRRRSKPVDAQRVQRRGWRHRLLVLGGSGGAQSLNEFVPKALYKLQDRLAGWQIVHQTGPRDVAATKELYRKLMIDAVVAPFVQNMPSVLRRTDVAVCRAGGTTLAELAATGVPAVLIPYPHAAQDHQRHNAEVFRLAGAARIVDERNASLRLDDALAATLFDLLADAEVRNSMSSAMLRLARPYAARQVAMAVHEMASHSAARHAA